MKKLISILSIAALALTTSVALAHNDNNDDDNGNKARVEGSVEANEHFNFPANIRLGLEKFVAVGSVAARGSSSLTLNVQAGAHLNNVSNGQVTVATNVETQTSGSVDVGDKVIVRGEIVANGSLEADSVRVIGEGNGNAEVKAKKQVVFGEVTAVTDSSVTLKNNVTGEVKTFATNEDTGVKVNGESKTTADIQVGDRGMIKFKAMLDTFVAAMIRLFR